MDQWFEKKRIACLQRDLWQTQEREQTQEVRLEEGMPDVGSVIWARGQCVLRSKEWNGGSVGVSGGVMVWVVYDPADDSGPRMVETWIPVQASFDIHDSKREGCIRTALRLRSVDARSTSPRKLMVRANVSVLVEALEPWETEVSVPAVMPGEVQVLKNSYPAVLPVEAGEKLIDLEQTLSVPSGMPEPIKVLAAELEPRLLEQKILGGKAVFRGNGIVRVCYEGTGGVVRWTDLEFPFSQFSDLDRDYGEDATVCAMVCLTNLETEVREGKLALSGKLLVQYVVLDRILLELAEDAYSLGSTLQIQRESLQLPMILDRTVEDLRFPVSVRGEAEEILDTWCFVAQPEIRRAGDLAQIQVSGVAGAMYRDREGRVRGCCNGWNHSLEHKVDADVGLHVMVDTVERPAAIINGDEITLKMDFRIRSNAVMCRGMETVTGLEPGEATAPAPNRPSVILRRLNGESLWNLAKDSGSTVEAIRKANGLSGEPVDGRMLLIPVY